MHHVEQRGVIFVDEYNHLLARLLVCSLYQCSETIIVVGGGISDAIFTLIFRKAIAKIAFQLLLLHVLARSHA